MRLIRLVVLIIGMMATSAGEAQAWFDNQYDYKQTITIQATQVSGGPHTDFPVLITEANLDPVFFPNVRKPANAQNIDVIFTDEYETHELMREIVVFDGLANSLVAFVRVDWISNTRNAVIHMYYGNASADRANDRETWSNGYAGVWHLAEAAGAPWESGLNNIATAYQSTLPRRQLGQFGFCQNFNDANTDYVSCADAPALDIYGDTASVTVEAWINIPSTTSTWSTIAGKGDYQYILQRENTSRRIRFAVYEGSNSWPYAQTTNQLNTNNWYHLAGRYDGSSNSVNLFLDGNLQATAGTAAAINHNAGQPVALGRDLDNNAPERLFRGMMQEIRISNVPRADGWLISTYRNQNDPAAFYNAGTEQSRLWTPTITHTFTASPTFTATPTFTRSATDTPSPTASPTPSYTPTESVTASITETFTHTATATPSLTPTHSASITETFTNTETFTRTETVTQTETFTRTETETVTLTSTLSETHTLTETFTASPTQTYTLTMTATPTLTITRTFSATATATRSGTITCTMTITPTMTVTQRLLPASNLSQVVVYPNPFKIGRQFNRELVFLNLPRRVDIRLYDLNGAVIAEIAKNNALPSAVWNLKNSAHQPVASGVYIYIIKSAAEAITGKVVILR